MDKRVHLLGAKPDVCSYVSSLDVFLLTSMAEGFPNVLGEAMASGLPCVTTNVGDCKRIIGSYGVVADNDDVKSMAKAVTKVLQMSQQDRSALGASARNLIKQKFSIKVISELYWRYYCENPNFEKETNIVKK